MLSNRLPAAGRLALMAAAGILAIAPSTLAVINSPTATVPPRREPVTEQEDPQGTRVAYQPAWVNLDQKTFGAVINTTLTKAGEKPSMVVRFKFASTNTKIDQFWGDCNLTMYASDWCMLAVTSSTPGQPDLAPRDTSPHSCYFNGHFTGEDDPNAIYPNAYTIAPDPLASTVQLSPNEVTHVPMVSEQGFLPTAPFGPYIRQRKSAGDANGGNAQPTSELASSAASGGKTDSAPSSSGGSTLSGLLAFCAVLAVGLTVVGVATYRRRQHRSDFRNQQARTIGKGGSPSAMEDAVQGDSVAVPEPSAINNRSSAARAAAGAVVMQEMAPEQAVAQDFYMDEVVPHTQTLDDQQVGQADDTYYAHYDGQATAEEFEAQPHDDQVYMEGLPDYAVQYDDGNAELEVEAIYNSAAANVNSAVEHVDLRPPVAQEYYVADTVAYDDAQHGGEHGMEHETVDYHDGAVYADDGAVYADDGAVYADDGAAYADDGAVYADDGGVYADDGGVYAQDGADTWPETTHDDQGGYAEDGTYHADDMSQMPPAGTEEYTAYEATEFEADDHHGQQYQRQQ